MLFSIILSIKAREFDLNQSYSCFLHLQSHPYRKGENKKSY